MAFIEKNIVKAQNKAGGKGEITIKHLLGAKELDNKCAMFAEVTIPPHASIGIHEHHGNTETYYILRGTALYNDNGAEKTISAGEVTFCPDGEKHGIENISDTEDLVFMAVIINK